jgi:sporulation protein YlmC with PRC-barrel domain
MNHDRWHGQELVDLGTQLLDRQITGPEAVKVGKVDDLELTRRDDGSLEVTGLLVGVSALRERVPRNIRWLLDFGMRMAGGPDAPRRIDLGQVLDVGSDIEVTADAAAGAASATERRLRRIVRRIPGADREGE